MTVALLLLAAGALLWPGRPRVVQRLRPHRPRAVLRPPPAVLAAATALGCALVTTPVVAGLAAAGAWAVLRARRRQAGERDAQAQVAALAEALGVLAAELRAGRPLGDAAATAVAGCPHPRAAEALRPALVGGPAPPGVTAPARSALDRIATARAVSVRTGCSLAAAVGAAEDDLRARARTREELDVALAGPRASSRVLAGLPVLGLLMGAGIGADPWTVLTTTPVGTALLVAGCGLEAAGLAWTRRLTERAADR
ncbi:type II secretion system F family protein [Klenkia taihuensis]|uniref:Tight adherence protein B n=1 Tax=Klenkia taihuensis TaxID=1225127 RepID=A0A1I1NGS7_9ACTN|nr:hypothetical protein [Klenkia taihuensis]GHE12134.1 hypothetical protein GCM10011381_28710 [Klenkia taihuensis]SFC93953.1 tight adherence protein B [Klenkia taihuensis]